MKFWTGSLWCSIFALDSVLTRGQGSLWSKEMVLTLYFRPEIFNEDSQPHRGKRVCFQGFSNFQEHQLTLCGISYPVYSNSGWQCHHCDCNPHWPSPPHPHVLLSKCPLLSDTFYSLVIIPRMISSLVGLSQSTSLEGCGAQLFSFLGFALTNCLLLAIRGYACYAAICHFITRSSWTGGSVPGWHPQSVPWGSHSRWFRLWPFSDCPFARHWLSIFSAMFNLCWTWPVLPQSSMISWP